MDADRLTAELMRNLRNINRDVMEPQQQRQALQTGILVNDFQVRLYSFSTGTPWWHPRPATVRKHVPDQDA